MICPQCTDKFVLDNDSGYQVNDHFELTFCSYECSLEYTIQRKYTDKLKNLSDDELMDGV